MHRLPHQAVTTPRINRLLSSVSSIIQPKTLYKILAKASLSLAEMPPKPFQNPPKPPKKLQKLISHPAAARPKREAPGPRRPCRAAFPLWAMFWQLSQFPISQRPAVLPSLPLPRSLLRTQSIHSPTRKSHSFGLLCLLLLRPISSSSSACDVGIPLDFNRRFSTEILCASIERVAGRACGRAVGDSEATQGRLYDNLRQPVSRRNMTALHLDVPGDDDSEPLGLHHRACNIDTERDMAIDVVAAIPLSRKLRQRGPRINSKAALVALLAMVPGAMAQDCISLKGSTQCPAFSSASISTDSSLFGFLYVLLPR